MIAEQDNGFISPFKVSEIRFKGGAPVDTSSAEIIVLVGPNNTGKSRSLEELHQTLTYHVGRSIDPENFIALKSVKIIRNLFGPDLFEWLRQQRYYWTAPNGEEVLRALERSERHNLIPISSILADWSRTESAALGFLGRQMVCMLACTQRLDYHTSSPRLAVTDDPETPGQLITYNEELLALFREAFQEAFHKNIIVDAWGTQIDLRVSENETQEDFATQTTDGLPNADIAKRVAKLPLIHWQGHGVRSFTGILMTLLATRYPVVLIDEPEAFLHPPQARLLGRFLSKIQRGGQIFVATHSLDIILGLLDGQSDKVSIVRLTRDSDITHAHGLESKRIAQLWSDPLLRFSRVLDGLFHEMVIVCEGDTDSQFYSAIAAYNGARSGANATDVMFTFAGAKHRIPLITRALRALGVPVGAIVDFDALNDKNVLQSLVEGLGADYSGELEKDRKLVDDHIRAGVQQIKAGEALAQIKGILGEDHPHRPITSTMVGKIRAAIEPENHWKAAKKSGKSAVPSGEASVALDRLIMRLSEIGVFVVPTGAVESFVKTVGGKGPQWVVEVVEKGLIDSAHEAQQFIEMALKSLQSTGIHEH